MNLKTEKILVVPAASLPQELISQGIEDFTADALDALLEFSEMRPRNLMEEDPSFKQIIPYVVVMNEKEEILTYQRSQKGGDSRLHHRYSIGVGGHLDETPGVAPGVDLFYDGMVREVKEEIAYSASPENFTIIATIYDDSNSVGSVHFGIVAVLRVDGGQFFHLGEADILIDREFLTLDELIKRRESLENWSVFLVEHLAAKSTGAVE